MKTYEIEIKKMKEEKRRNELKAEFIKQKEAAFSAGAFYQHGFKELNIKIAKDKKKQLILEMRVNDLHTTYCIANEKLRDTESKIVAEFMNIEFKQNL